MAIGEVVQNKTNNPISAKERYGSVLSYHEGLDTETEQRQVKPKSIQRNGTDSLNGQP